MWTFVPFRGWPLLAMMITTSLDDAERSIVHRTAWREWRDLLQHTGVEGGRRLKGPFHIDDRLRRGTCCRFPTWLGLVLVRDALTKDAIPRF